jgi:hypothetical protein
LWEHTIKIEDFDKDFSAEWEKEVKEAIDTFYTGLFGSIRRVLWSLCFRGGANVFVKSSTLPFLERIRDLLDKGDLLKIPEDFLSDHSQFFLFKEMRNERYRHPSDPGEFFPDYFAEGEKSSFEFLYVCPERFDLCLVLVAASPLSQQEVIKEEELDNLGESFECLLCKSELRQTFDWRSIVSTSSASSSLLMLTNGSYVAG